MGKGLILKVSPGDFSKVENGQKWLQMTKVSVHTKGELIKIIEVTSEGDSTGNYIMGNVTGHLTGTNDSYLVSFIKTCVIKPRVLVTT